MSQEVLEQDKHQASFVAGNNVEPVASVVSSELVSKSQSDWIECGSLPEKGKRSEIEVGKWILCVAENLFESSSQSKVKKIDTIWAKVVTKVASGDICFAKRTRNGYQNDETQNLVFIYSENCGDVQSVLHVATLIKNDIFDDFHVIYYFKETDFDWGTYYRCQQMLYKFTSDGQMFKLNRSDLWSSKNSTQDLASFRARVDECENSSYRKMEVVSNEEPNDNVTAFVESIIDGALEKVVKSKMKFLKPSVDDEVLDVDKSQSFEEKLSDFAPEINSELLSSQKFAKLASPEHFESFDAKVQASRAIDENLSSIEERIKAFQLVHDAVEQNGVSKTFGPPEHYLGRMSSTYAGDVPEASRADASSVEDESFISNSEKGSRLGSVDISNVDKNWNALKVSFEQSTNDTLSKMSEFSDRLKNMRSRVSVEDAEDQGSMGLKSFRLKINEHQRLNEEKLAQMKEKISEMRQNFQNKTALNQDSTSNAFQVFCHSKTQATECRDLIANFEEKRSQHRQTIADMKRRVNEALERIKNLSAHSQEFVGCYHDAEKWLPVEMNNEWVVKTMFWTESMLSWVILLKS